MAAPPAERQAEPRVELPRGLLPSALRLFDDVEVADLDQHSDFVTLRLLEGATGEELRAWFAAVGEPDLGTLPAERCLTLRSLRFWRLVVQGQLDAEQRATASPTAASPAAASPAAEWWPL